MKRSARPGEWLTLAVNVMNWPYTIIIGDTSVPAFPEKQRDMYGNITATASIKCPDIPEGQYAVYLKDRMGEHKVGSVKVIR